MFSYLIVFIIITLTIVSNTDFSEEQPNYIKIQLRHYYGSKWDFPVYINNSTKPVTVIPDLNSSYAIIYEGHYIYNRVEESSNINHSIQIIYKGNSLQAEEANHSFRFKETQDFTVNLTYYHTNQYISSLSSIIGFAYSYDKEEQSLVHQLYKLKLIPSLTFSIINKYETQTMFLGGLPSHYTERTNYSYIDIIGNSNQWDFYISEVRIKNETKEINYLQKKTAYLISLESFIAAPTDFFDRLVIDFFDDLVKEKHCHILDNRPNRYFLCSIHPKVRKGDITFLINGFVYDYPLESFWSCGEEYCIFSIRENSLEDQWAIGLDFYLTFSMLFDYKKKRIEIYSKSMSVYKIDTYDANNNNKKSIGFDNSNIKTKQFISVFTLILSSIGIITLIYIKSHINNKSTQRVIKF